MQKKFLTFALALILALGLSFTSEAFSDVSNKHKNFEAITKLNELGIINGYNDGTFKPGKGISRAEAAAIFVRGIDYHKKGDVPEIAAYPGFIDVDSRHWSYEPIYQAATKGLMKGVGNGKFEPKRQVTYHEIIKMTVSLLGLDADAEMAGGWPLGYVKIAQKEGLLEGLNYKGSAPAKREDVALILYNAFMDGRGTPVILGGGEFYLGMKADQLGAADEVLQSNEGFDWQFYGTDTYENFYAVGVKDGVVVALASSGLGFEYNGLKAGMVLSPAAEVVKTLFLDKNDGSKIHGLMLKDLKLAYDGEKMNMLEGHIYCEERLNFHLTNGFRVYHGLSPLTWSLEAWKSARLHSEDMANQNYFSHEGLNGSQPWDRMRAQGVVYTSASENIAAGQRSGFEAYDSWVNSAGHRANMLGDSAYLGVGMSYNPRAEYQYYYTQNFYK